MEATSSPLPKATTIVGNITSAELFGIFFAIFLLGYTIWFVLATYDRYKHIKAERLAKAAAQAVATSKAAHRFSECDKDTLSGATIVGDTSPKNSPSPIIRPSRPLYDESYQKLAQNHFEEDDGGDGLGPNTKDIPLADMSVSEYPHREFRVNPGNYMTMGLRKLDILNWLTLDKFYKEFYAARDLILKIKSAEVVQCLPEGDDAAEELLGVVIEFLTHKYPNMFRVYETKDGKKLIQNRIVEEEFSLNKPFEMHPLEICARLAMEDFNLLMKNESTGEHHLVGSATLFPAGWHLRERIGMSVTSLHKPVPQWKGKLSKPVEHYFNRIRPTSCMERSTCFIQTRPEDRNLAQTLFIQEPKDFFSGGFGCLNPDNMLVRRERQTFRRLEKSSAIVFTVKTSITKMSNLSAEERKGLAREIRAWPEDIAKYKGFDLWGTPVLRWCDGESFEVDDETVYSGASVHTKVL